MKEYCGRYIYIEPSENSKKFWHLIWDNSRQRFEAHWGRLGQRSQVTYYDQATGIKKAKEKLKKGYKYIEGHEKEKGCNLEHFIFMD